MIIFIKRATLVVALFFNIKIFALDQKLNAAAVIKVESYKEIILKAQTFLSQKNRAESVAVLLSGLQKEDVKSIGHLELMKKLTKATHMFLGEASQSIYELAITLDKTNKKIAIDKLNEALALEPQNLQIIKALLVRALSDFNCLKSIKLMESYKQINPLDPEIFAYEVLIAICQKDQIKYNELKKATDSNNPGFQEFWLLSDLRIKIITGSENQNINIESKSHYPEIIYSKWKLSEGSPQEIALLSEEYLQICKTWKSPYMGSNFPDPWVCNNIKEVEEAKEKK
jgi:hypothetical protein